MTVQRSMGMKVRRTLSRTWRPVQNAVQRQVLRCADALVMAAPRGCTSARVLLVRLDNIGDFALWLETARALVAHYREQGFEVSLLASASWAEFAWELGIFDEVVTLDQERFKRSLGYRHRMLRMLRAAGFAKVVQPTVTRVPEMGDAIAWVSGAPERVGVAMAGESNKPKPRRLGRSFTRLISVDAAALGELRANAEFVRQLTGSPFEARVADLQPAIDNDCLEALKDHMPPAPYVVLFPGASEAGKRWPKERFQQIAMRFREESGYAVLICGGPGDASVADAIATACGDGVTSLGGKTSLKQLTAVLAGAQLLVSNDTAAVHLAAAVGVASVCIVGGGHYGRFLPYKTEVVDTRPVPLIATQPMECFGCNWVCRYHPAKGHAMPCVEGVPVQTVWDLANTILRPQVEEAAACR